MMTISEVHKLLQEKLSPEEYESVTQFVQREIAESMAQGYQHGYQAALDNHQITRKVTLEEAGDLTELCWAQGVADRHCRLPKGHEGDHDFDVQTSRSSNPDSPFGI